MAAFAGVMASDREDCRGSGGSAGLIFSPTMVLEYITQKN